MSKDILYPLRKLHGRMHEFKLYVWPILATRMKNPHALFLVLTPEHDNLGDQALAVSEKKMLDRLGIEYIELTEKDIRLLDDYNCLNVMNGRPILFNGGGNLGTLWPSVEKATRTIIKRNPRSTICFLPNTIYYEDTPEGNIERDLSVDIYNAHRSLYLYAREELSYFMMKELYKNVKLMPDMVMSMNIDIAEYPRKGCLLCLREDKERTRSENDEEKIISQASLLFDECVTQTDMYAGYTITPPDREAELEKKFIQFKQAELVITDRLHGMIFAAITGTPCIVINSKSPKIKGCYKWFEHLDYIRFAEEIEQIGEIYKDIPKQTHQYDNSPLYPYFSELEQDILRLARKK